MAGELPSLASPSDLCDRLGIETPAEGTPEFRQMSTLLKDASGEMRASIGQDISRNTTTVYLVATGYEERYRHGRRQSMAYVDLPAIPVVSIAEIKVDGELLEDDDWFIRYRTVFMPMLHSDSEIEITYTYGFDPLPEEIVKWTCILAAAALSAAEKTGALGVTAGISQHARTIDDYTESWANYTGNKAPGMTLPPDVQTRLASVYGMGGISTVSHR